MAKHIKKIIDIVTELNIDKKAWEAYIKTKEIGDIYKFLQTAPEFPKDRVPKSATGCYHLVNDLVERFGEGDTIIADGDFECIRKCVSDILKVDAGPQGALLQNLVKACLSRISELENSAKVVPDRNTDVAIAKYISEIRNLTESISKLNKDQSDMYRSIEKRVTTDANTVMDAVKEAVIELMPTKIEDFKRLLSAKLVDLKKPSANF